MKDHVYMRFLSTLIAFGILTFLCLSIRAHPGSGIMVDRRGQVYFMDTGSGLWRIDGQGKVEHLSTTLFHWLALDEGNLFAAGRLPTSAGTEFDWVISKVSKDPTVLIASDWPIALRRDGSLYYPVGRPGNLQLMRSLPSGSTSIFATLPATISGEPLPYVSDLAPGPANTLYYTEDKAVRRITANGRVELVVKVPAAANPPSIPATGTRPYLRGIAVAANGVMYVADTGDARVLKITPMGKITTLIATESPWSPTGVAIHGGEVYVLEYLHTVRDVRRDWLPRVRKITADGKSKIILTVDQMPGAR